jgi:hypothetical protein
MKNHWLRKKDYRECERIKKEILHDWSEATPEAITVTTFDKALSQEEIEQLSTIEIVGDNIVVEGDSILFKGNVTIVGDLTVDGNLTITDCMAVNAEQEVNVIDCTFSSPPPDKNTISSPMGIYSMSDCIIKDMMDKEDRKFLDACGIGELA